MAIRLIREIRGCCLLLRSLFFIIVGNLEEGWNGSRRCSTFVLSMKHIDRVIQVLHASFISFYLPTKQSLKTLNSKL